MNARIRLQSGKGGEMAAINFVVSKSSQKTFVPKNEYKTQYEDIICAGELVRNLCVNLGIDPDTVDGITKNVNVYLLQSESENREAWQYNPNRSIGKYFHPNSTILMEIEQLD